MEYCDIVTYIHVQVKYFTDGIKNKNRATNIAPRSSFNLSGAEASNIQG